MNPHSSKNSSNANTCRDHGNERLVPSGFLPQYIGQWRAFGLDLTTIEKTLQILAERSRRFITTLRFPLEARHDNGFELLRDTFTNTPERRRILVNDLRQYRQSIGTHEW